MLEGLQSEKSTLEDNIRKAIEAGNKKDVALKGVDRDLEAAQSELERVQKENSKLQQDVTAARDKSSTAEEAIKEVQSKLELVQKELAQKNLALQDLKDQGKVYVAHIKGKAKY